MYEEIPQRRKGKNWWAIMGIAGGVVIALCWLGIWFIDLAERFDWGADRTVSASSVVSEPVSSEEADETWAQLLVNEAHPLPDGYEKNLTFVELRGDVRVDERMYPDLQKMMDDCRAAGLRPLIALGYRSVATQQELYDKKVKSYIKEGYSRQKAQEEAKKNVVLPGVSEHHTGLAVDIVAESYQYRDKKLEKKPELNWLRLHCSEYGFIQRYPADKAALTGVDYEPWHFRYVGKKTAKYLTENHLCLEELTA